MRINKRISETEGFHRPRRPLSESRKDICQKLKEKSSITQTMNFPFFSGVRSLCPLPQFGDKISTIKN